MHIIKQVEQGNLNVGLSGQFTFSDHAEFREILQHIEKNDVSLVTLNMSGVDFVDSAALGMLLLTLEEVQKHHKTLIIKGANGQVKKMFDMANFNTIFTMQ